MPNFTTSTTAQKIVSADPTRTSLFFENTDTSITIDLAYSVAGLLSLTIYDKRLLPGTNVSLTLRDDGELVKKEWWVIAASGSPVVSVIEGIGGTG